MPFFKIVEFIYTTLNVESERIAVRFLREVYVRVVSNLFDTLSKRQHEMPREGIELKRPKQENLANN